MTVELCNDPGGVGDRQPRLMAGGSLPGAVSGGLEGAVRRPWALSRALVVCCGCDRGIVALSHRGQGRGDSGRSVQRTHHSQLVCSPRIPQPQPGELAVASAISTEAGAAGSWGGDR